MAAAGPDPPLGLSQLSALEKVLVRKKAYAGSKYEVLGPDGVVLLAKDEANVMGQLLGGTNRALNIDVFDTQDRLVMTLRRPCTLGQAKMEVAVGGRAAARVRQEPTLVKPVLSVADPAGRPLLRVKGPAHPAADTDFQVLGVDKQKVGVIRKCWGADSFQLLFAPRLDPQVKATVLATCFLIDFLYYES